MNTIVSLFHLIIVGVKLASFFFWTIIFEKYSSLFKKSCFFIVISKKLFITEYSQSVNGRFWSSNLGFIPNIRFSDYILGSNSRIGELTTNTINRLTFTNYQCKIILQMLVCLIDMIYPPRPTKTSVTKSDKKGDKNSGDELVCKILFRCFLFFYFIFYSRMMKILKMIYSMMLKYKRTHKMRKPNQILQVPM